MTRRNDARESVADLAAAMVHSLPASHQGGGERPPEAISVTLAGVDRDQPVTTASIAAGQATRRVSEYQTAGAGPIGLDAIFEPEDTDERPDLARLIHLRRYGDCSMMSTSTFYPARGQPAPAAKVACQSCTVRAECLAYALEHHEMFGIWGGTSEKERRALQVLHRQGEAVERIVARAIAGDLDEAMAGRRSSARRTERSSKIAPYGWVRQGGEIVPNENEQGVIARLRRWSSEGVSAAEAARRLGAVGIRTRRGEEWQAATVVGVLSRRSSFLASTQRQTA